MQIQCPFCSQLYEVYQSQQEVVTCQSCGRKFRLPKTEPPQAANTTPEINPSLSQPAPPEQYPYDQYQNANMFGLEELSSLPTDEAPSFLPDDRRSRRREYREISQEYEDEKIRSAQLNQQMRQLEQRKTSSDIGGTRLHYFVGFLVCLGFTFIYGIIVVATQTIIPLFCLALVMGMLTCLVGMIMPGAGKKMQGDRSLLPPGTDSLRLGCIILVLFGVALMIFIAVVLWVTRNGH